MINADISLNIQETILKPAFTEKNIVIAIASSDIYVKFLLVLLASIKANISKDFNYDIVILSDGITVMHKKKIVREVVQKNISVRFISGEAWLENINLYTALHLTKTTYLRLAVIDIFSIYEKVIYLDCDTVVNTDISSLFEIDINGYMLASVTDSIMFGWCHMVDNNGKDQYAYISQSLGITDAQNYFNAGVLLINIKEFNRRHYSTRALLKIACEKEWRWFDQDVLNLVCKDCVKYIDSKWNVMVHSYRDESSISEWYLPEEKYEIYKMAVRSPYIVHYAGNVIPVYAPKVDCRHLFWKYARMSGGYFVLIIILIKNKVKHFAKKYSKEGLY